VTLPQLLDEVVQDLESQSDVESALTEFFDMVGTLLQLDAMALFSVPDNVSEAPVLIQGRDTVNHGNIDIELPAQLLARIRLQQKGFMPLDRHEGPCAPNDVFPIGRPIHWGLAVAIRQRDAISGVLVLGARQEPETKGNLQSWLEDLGKHLGWCMAHVQLTRKMPLASMLQALDSTVGALAVTDARGRLQYANTAFLAHTGRSRREVIGRTLSGLFTRTEDVSADGGVPWHERPSVGLGTNRTLVKSAQEGGVNLELRLTPVLDDRGSVSHGLALLIELPLQLPAVVVEQQETFHGLLGALPGRAVLLDRLQMSLNRMRGGHTGPVMIVINLDRFRTVTDSLGEDAGTQLLLKVAHRIETLVSDSDTVSWLGADEFGVLLENVRDPTHAIRLCKELASYLQEPLTIAGNPLFATCSAGIAMAAHDSRQARELLRDATTALSRAKKSQTTMYCLFDRDMHREALLRLKLETDLRLAIDRGEFLLHFQPIVDLKRGTIDSFEALIRWDRSAQEIVGPDEFIPIAEDTGLIVEMGRWVLESACLEARKWLDAVGPAAPSVSVNVSPRQFEHPDIYEHVLAALERSGLPPGRLKLEITESCLMERVREKIDLLNRLKDLGVMTQVDDFGTGYSSLGLLTQLPVDSLKIDRSFVNRMASGDADGKVVRAVIELAHSLGLKVTAEGIESDDQRCELLELACDRGQGYLFSRPITAEAAITAMTKRRK
jgi:diguanylate cyclase (GGDEF)-like protein/PAS domain S-box-containing protein